MAKWRGDARGAERWCHHARGDDGRGEKFWRGEGVRSSDRGHGWAMCIGNSSRGQVRKEAIACGASSSVSEAPVKETCEKWYATLFELVTSEDIYLVNFYGKVYKLDDGEPNELLRRRLVGVGKNVVGIMFGGCLVLLPADVAVKNLGYLRPVSVPRTNWLVTGTGTRVYDLRKDMQGLYHGGWTRVSLDNAAREFWAVVGEHYHPSAQNFPLYEYLMLETGVDAPPHRESQ